MEKEATGGDDQEMKEEAPNFVKEVNYENNSVDTQRCAKNVFFILNEVIMS